MPSYTRTVQHSPFPTSGSTGTTDGAPLSSRYGIDLMYGVNNFAYTYPWVGFVQSHNTLYPPNSHDSLFGGTVIGVYAINSPVSTTAKEAFAAQIPTVLPVDGVRFCWTIGLTAVAQSDTGKSSVLDSVSVYIAPSPYKDTFYDYDGTDLIISPTTSTDWDATKIGAPYSVSTKAVGTTVADGASSGYILVDNSAGDTGNWLPFKKATPGGLVQAHIIVTTSAHTLTSTDGYLELALQDFSFWVLPE